MANFVRSVRNPGHLYDIAAPRGGEETLLVPKGGADNVVIITGDGADLLTRDAVNADALRLNPRLKDTTQQIIRSAAIRRELDGPGPGKGVDG